MKAKNGRFDVLIVGGGINGAVAAAALAAKGVKVALIDRGDFGGKTSSNSSNLAWGGIKYLENHEYPLVARLCTSRNHLMSNYPATVKEIRFLATVSRGFRYPPVILYIGTLLYWVLGRFFTAPPKFLTTAAIRAREPVINTDDAVGGFEYSDAYFHDNDARFVFNFIRSSMNHGCVAANYMESVSAMYGENGWQLTVRDVIDNKQITVNASVLINACGPQVDEHNLKTCQQTEYRHIFSKGIHLIVDKVTKERRILTFFASDGRMLFAIPMGNKTSIGTTDTKASNPDTSVTPEDRNFVLDNINALLKLPSPITEQDIIAERCAVRPLAVKGDNQDRDWSRLSRKHIIECNHKERHLSIFGGKLTDCINVGNEVSKQVRALGIAIPYEARKWYGEDHPNIRDQFYHQARLMELNQYTVPGSPESLTERMWRRYGGKALEMLEAIRRQPQQAKRLMPEAEYLRCELEYTARYEMVTKLEDFIRRRSKISQVIAEQSIIDSPGLKEICKLLFDHQAEAKYQEWLASVQ